jgi:hypothetical protein
VSESSQEPTGSLQFDKAEFSSDIGKGPSACGHCQRPLVGSYFLLNGVPTCELCKTEADWPSPRAHVRGGVSRVRTVPRLRLGAGIDASRLPRGAGG